MKTHAKDTEVNDPAMDIWKEKRAVKIKIEKWFLILNAVTFIILQGIKGFYLLVWYFLNMSECASYWTLEIRALKMRNVH